MMFETTKMEGYFEDWQKGERYQLGERIVTEEDIELFSSLTGIQAPVFFNKEYAQQVGFSTRLTPALLVLPLAVGKLYQSGALNNMVALLGLDKFKFTSPIYPGEAMQLAAHVMDKRETKRKDRGLVTIKVLIGKKDGEIAAEGEFTLLFRRRGHS